MLPLPYRSDIGDILHRVDGWIRRQDAAKLWFIASHITGRHMHLGRHLGGNRVLANITKREKKRHHRVVRLGKKRFLVEESVALALIGNHVATYSQGLCFRGESTQHVGMD